MTRANFTKATKRAAYERHHSCERKKWFRTQAQAEAAIVNMVERAYSCKWCDGWHLTTKPAPTWSRT